MPILAWSLTTLSTMELHAEPRPGNVVPVRLRVGGRRCIPWLGFLEREQALRMPDARPVKLDVSRYYCDHARIWVDLAPYQLVQGCLVAEGVYGVPDGGMVRLV